MDIYTAINDAIKNPPGSMQAAANLLAPYSPKVQEQLIAAIYLGRSHINHTTMDSQYDWTCKATDHISAADYPQIVYEKSSSGSAATYLQKLLDLSQAAGYDLRTM